MAGNMENSAFKRGYELTASRLSSYRSQWKARQADIDASYSLSLSRAAAAESYMQQDLFRTDDIYSQTMASLADRYGKRIDYFQSLKIIENNRRKWETN